MDSKASPSLAQPGIFLRSSLIRSMHTGARRTFSCDFSFIEWWTRRGSGRRLRSYMPTARWHCPQNLRQTQTAEIKGRDLLTLRNRHGNAPQKRFQTRPMGRVFKRCSVVKFPVSLRTAAEASKMFFCVFWSLIFNWPFPYASPCRHVQEKMAAEPRLGTESRLGIGGMTEPRLGPTRRRWRTHGVKWWSEGDSAPRRS